MAAGRRVLCPLSLLRDVCVLPCAPLCNGPRCRSTMPLTGEVRGGDKGAALEAYGGGRGQGEGNVRCGRGRRVLWLFSLSSRVCGGGPARRREGGGGEGGGGGKGKLKPPAVTLASVAAGSTLARMLRSSFRFKGVCCR